MLGFHVRLLLPTGNNNKPTKKTFLWPLTRLSIFLHFLFINSTFSETKHEQLPPAPLQLRIQDRYVELDNGVVQVTLSKPGGSVTGIRYNGVDNLLEGQNEEINRGYWDLVWIGNGSQGKKGSLDRLEGTDFKVILENEEQIEVSFTRTWNTSLDGKQVPLNIDKRFILLHDSCGFYSYGIYERLEGWPAFHLTNTRIAFKLREDKFQYMAISNDRQRHMPLPEDRLPPRGEALAYPEAVHLVDPIEPEFKGEVDDKYQYSLENKDNRVHGWISPDYPPIGFWQITPSDEFRSGGPLKQCLNSHVGPTCLAIFHSTHYSGEDLILKFRANETWKKVYGPVFIYLNSLSDRAAKPLELWEDAKQQMRTEVQKWPYDFPQSNDFPLSSQRGDVCGRLLLLDKYVIDENMPADGAFVGLASPGDVGSWQRESKGYQFWTGANKDGFFCINHIRAGNYNLYAWVPGYIGDYRYDKLLTVTPGSAIEVGNLVYEPPRNGPTLWEIGIPDRTAAEFYVPDPNPNFINKLYLNGPNKFRQYGLWERYAELYPQNDLVYTVGLSDYSKDWFFAQVTRKTANNTYVGSTWQIRFKLENVNKAEIYTLRIALATAHSSELQITPTMSSSKGVQLSYEDPNYVIMDNGIVQVTLTKPDGNVTGIKYNGIKNLLEFDNKESGRGYWDLDWSGTKGMSHQVIQGTEFKIIVQNEEQVEISFTTNWDTSQEGKFAPLNIDKRFIMLRDSPGLYSYAIYEHMKEWPAFNLVQTRIVFKLRKDEFRYMAVGDQRQRYMPLPDDLLPPRGEELAFSEAVRLVDPIEPEFKGEVDDKYEYSCENKDLKVHGWICTNPAIGFWQITPSNEFRSGGLIKQNLTSHVGPVNLAMFLSTHYAGDQMELKFQENEAWKKVLGPVFFYLNSLPTDGTDPLTYLWDDAKNQMMVEVESWPYSFIASEDFPRSDQRGSLSGILLVQDRYISSHNIPGCGAYVGLAPPGEVGSWQTESKGYQFWTKADECGYFCINDVRSGNYNLYAWVPGFIGDYKYNNAINITAGGDIDVGDIVYEPPRDGATLWEIGIPDRSAGEFYVPDPNPIYVNNLYLNQDSDRFRQYGLWERYAELYPDADLVYTVGTSDYKNDWFFAQVTRKNDDDTYKGTTWQIKFYLEHVSATGIYKLRIALAAAHQTRLEVKVNDLESEALLSRGQFGHDNAIARHGIHGLYWLYNVDIDCSLLVEGDNTIFLTQSKCGTAFQGLMYDYIRLECPPTYD
ncbi:hypothetical protein UlMin_036134 [Ulmus minor]